MTVSSSAATGLGLTNHRAAPEEASTAVERRAGPSATGAGGGGVAGPVRGGPGAEGRDDIAAFRHKRLSCIGVPRGSRPKAGLLACRGARPSPQADPSHRPGGQDGPLVLDVAKAVLARRLLLGR